MRPTLLFRNFGLAVLAVLTLGLGSSAQADTINVVGVDTGQFSTATVVCEFNSQTNTFTFTITNTSAITTPGSTSTITGIGFDLPPVWKCQSFRVEWFHGFSGAEPVIRLRFFGRGPRECTARIHSAVLDFGFPPALWQLQRRFSRRRVGTG